MNEEEKMYSLLNELYTEKAILENTLAQKDLSGYDKDLLEQYQEELDLYKRTIDYIEKLQKENKELKNESKSKQKAYDDCYCEYKHYKQYDSIPKDKIKELIKKLEKAEKDIKIDAGAFELPKADALTMFRLNILAGYASSVELLRILLEEE